MNSWIGSLKSLVFAGFAFAAAILGQDGWALDIQKSKQAEFKVVRLVNGLYHPWSIAFLPGGDFLVTERSGQLNRINKDSFKPKVINGLPKIESLGQGGLMDVAIHPDFEKNQLVYLSYS
ncbi:MAG: PQQ-dependent sugar dehydrogenase, partial [Desulfobulbia bacterium]